MNDIPDELCGYTISEPSSKTIGSYYSGDFELNMTFSLFILFTICIIMIIGNKKLSDNGQKRSRQQRMVVEAAIKEFEKKAEHQPILGLLAGEATDLLETFKNNIHAVYAYKLNRDEFHFNEFSNKISKIKLYDGHVIAVTLHIFPADFKENLEYHNHSKTMLLQNFCGEYIHTTWRINTATSGKLYKFAYERNQENGGEEINGSLEYMVMDNYRAGNWKCLHPATIHTITAASNTPRIISFVIKSKLNPNQDRFVLSTRPTLDIPTLKRVEIKGEERENILKYIIDSA